MLKSVKRNFIPGEEWLYYKLYCGIHTANIILERKIGPITKKLLKDKLIKQWFFIRYNDPDPHLRIRFKLENNNSLCGVIEEFNKSIFAYLKNNMIWKVQIDTYQRELERYGSNSIDISEELFFYDSELILNNIALIKDDEMFFLHTLKCIDSFLTVFQFNKPQKLVFYTENALAFKNEFAIEKSTKSSLGKKYSLVHENLSKVIDGYELTKKSNNLGKKMADRNRSMNDLALKIIEYSKTDLLEVKFDVLLSSYIHMFANRSFKSRQRFYEMLAYDFLSRYYKTLVVR